MHRAFDGAFPKHYPAEDGLHSFEHEAGRNVNSALEKAGLDEDAKRAVILKLHPNPKVGQLLLQWCGIIPRWLASNPARSLSRLMRRHEYSTALTRNLLERLGNDLNPYYRIGPNYRIPEPPEEDRAHCVQSMQELGFSEDVIIDGSAPVLELDIGGTAKQAVMTVLSGTRVTATPTGSPSAGTRSPWTT